MTTLCDAGCSRVATTRGADGADYCPECYKASKGGRRETVRRAIYSLDAGQDIREKVFASLVQGIGTQRGRAARVRADSTEPDNPPKEAHT